MKKIPLKYFQQHDVLDVSQFLLGKFLMTHIGGVTTGGIIIETEAYRAPEDRASHAYGGKRTPRNAPMYKSGGICYVYQCYGIHALLNIITGEEEVPHGVLIRAIRPMIGIDMMLKRRKKKKLDKTVASGPGNVTQALGITTKHNQLPLTGPEIWIEDRGNVVKKEEIISSPRIGVDYAGEDALLPWRFRFIQN